MVDRTESCTGRSPEKLKVTAQLNGSRKRDKNTAEEKSGESIERGNNGTVTRRPHGGGAYMRSLRADKTTRQRSAKQAFL
eukprot:5225930-Pleurochrysis_carterae.AAC.1